LTDISRETRTFLENVKEVSRVVFFVGAGVSVPAGYPPWATATQRALDLAGARGLDEAAAGYARSQLARAQYYDVFEILQHELPEPTFYEIAEQVFSGGAGPAEAHRLLVRTGCRGVITTNFDNCLESAAVLEIKGLPLQDFAQAMASDKFFVLKPHGSILVPRSMVLSRSDWMRVESSAVFRELVAQCVGVNQFVFIGYSMRDPDFNRMWDHVLRERVFRSPAIYCCAKGAVRPEQIQEFRDKKVAVVEFPDDGTFAFVPKILTALIGRTSVVCIPGDSGAAKTEKLAHELERYVLLCLHFSPMQQNRLVLVTKALIWEFFAVSERDLADPDSLVKHAMNALGQDSPTIRDATNLAIRELVASNFVKAEGALLRVEGSQLRAMGEQAEKLERAQSEWIDHALAVEGQELGVEIETGDQKKVAQLAEQVLMGCGRQVAELFLFNRPPEDESEKIDEIVEAFCAERGLGGKQAFFRRVVKQMMFDPGEGNEEILFKKLQSYFIASAYVLDPTSERLLSDYARDHWVYFDSSVILPAMAVGHPSHQVYRRLLTRSHALGMRLKVIRDMVNEVWANIRSALDAFKEFSRTSVNMQDVLEGYLEMYGAGNGNVFLEGMLARLKLDQQLTPAGYMAEILGPNDLTASEDQVARAISDSLGIECDSLEAGEIDRGELAAIASNIEFLRKHANRFKTQKLCEHEARQFYLIHVRRRQNPALEAKIWFVTTDRFLVELQRLEKDRYPLPISYTPRSWFQYLDLIDVQSRGSRHFSRLQSRMRFGVVSGDLGIEAIQTIIKEQRDLLKKGVVSVRELAQAAVRDYHVRQSIHDYDKKSGSTQDSSLSSEAKGKIRSDIKKVVDQFVAIRVQEIEGIKRERDAAKAEARSFERKLAKEKHVARTLKAQRKPRKTKKRGRH
jgi:hypothetical protein